MEGNDFARVIQEDRAARQAKQWQGTLLEYLELAKAEMPGIGIAPGGAMAMEDVCDLQPLAAHGRRLHSASRSPFDRRHELVVIGPVILPDCGL